MSKSKQSSAQQFMNWIEDRIPIVSFVENELVNYKTPKNLNYLWNFGSLAGITLVIMILSGLWLAFHYVPNTQLAFQSVERIMRDVNFGWLLRYIHMNGASMFFIVIYIHIMRGLYYGSYKAPREILWMLGVVILLLLMATAFMGYTLPWGQMSYWGATVITNLLSSLPNVFVMSFLILFGFFARAWILVNPSYFKKFPRFLRTHLHNIIFANCIAILMTLLLPLGPLTKFTNFVLTPVFWISNWVGEAIVHTLWGGYAVDNPTLNRFFVFHFLFPFLIVGVTALHLIALHKKGSNNPTGEDLPEKEKIPFHPYYTIKDFFGLAIFLTIWAFFVFFAPDFFGEPDNYIPADPLITPAHIVPEWYFLPFYAILRATPDKVAGVFLMFSAVFVLFFIPWLDYSPIRSARNRPLYKICFTFFLLTCILLGWAGRHPPEGLPLIIGRMTTIYYFVFFLICMPLISRLEIRALHKKKRSRL